MCKKNGRLIASKTTIYIHLYIHIYIEIYILIERRDKIKTDRQKMQHTRSSISFAESQRSKRALYT